MSKYASVYLTWVNGILLFWALWYTFVFFSDFTNFLAFLNIIPSTFPFNSENYDLVLKSFSTYAIHEGMITMFSFIIIIIWNLFSAIFFYYAFFKIMDKMYYGMIAFVFCIGQEAVFVLSDELFIKYHLESGHMARLGVKCATFILFLLIYYYIKTEKRVTS